MRHFHRGHLAFAHDLVMAAASFPVAIYLRVGEQWAPDWDDHILGLATVGLAVIAGAVFLSNRMYKGVWRYASLPDLMTLTRACTITLLFFYLAIFLVTRLDGLPRSVVVINWFVMIAFLGGPRLLYRTFKDARRAAKIAVDDNRIPVLLVGVGDEAELFIRASRSPESEYRAVALLSEKGSRVGRNIHGVDILGTVDHLHQALKQLKRKGDTPQRIIITDHRMDGSTVRFLLDEADRLGMVLARTPRLMDLKDGVSDKVQIRPIAVEDLLGRPQTVLDRAPVAAMIQGSRILVTGAGGSIGSELVRQICEYGPAQIVLVDACEFNLYAIDLELAQTYPSVPRRPVIGNIRDRERVKSIMAEVRPDVVFHAAALKHVPMVEHNPEEGVLTNAVGTRIVADACRAAGVRLMVQISTDKAVNPTNVMGASKRLAEMYAQALDLEGASTGETRFVTVRFGNVLGSTGSVVPLFQKQLAAGGPLTVTHPDMTRYFMTVREAVELVLQASAFGQDNPSYRGKIFVLDMGEPVKIVHLARQMIRLAGLRPDDDIEIVFTGLRPGEKLFEEIFHGAEPPLSTESKGILVAAPRAVNAARMADALASIEEHCRAHRVGPVLDALIRLVPEYTPDKTQAGVLKMAAVD